MLNKVFLIGNLTRDPDTRQTSNGSSVANIGLAVNRTYKDKQGNKVDDTTFVDCTAFGQSADFASQYLRKGNRVMIEGRLNLDTWEDRESGQQRSKLGVIVDRLQNLTPRSEATQQNDGFRGDNDRLDGLDSSHDDPFA